MIDTLFVDIGQVLVGLDFDSPLERIRQMNGLSPQEIRRRMSEHSLLLEYESGRLTSADFYHQISQLLEFDVPLGLFQEAWGSIFVLNDDDSGGCLTPRLFESLQHQYQMVALSNTNELHFEFLRDRFPLVNRFDRYVLSYEAGSVKPEKAIYLKALETAGRSAEQVLFIDDRSENIEAAAELGIEGIQFENEIQLKRELARLGLLEDLTK